MLDIIGRNTRFIVALCKGYSSKLCESGLARPRYEPATVSPASRLSTTAPVSMQSMSQPVRPSQSRAMVAYAKKNPDVLTIATAGAGTTMHLLAESLAGMADVKITHVRYKGSSEAVTAVLVGHTMATVDAIGTILPYVESGKMRVLLSFDPQPIARLPGVPTAKSFGYDLVYPAPYGLVGPKGMPPTVIDKLYQAFKAAADSDEYKKLLVALGQTEWQKSPVEYLQWAREFHVSERSLVECAKLLRQP